MAILKRVFMVGVGALLLVANSEGEAGTFLGMYPPTNAERAGFDAAKIALAALALWAIYRGIRPKTPKPAQTSEQPSA
jgi:hypothetical protein